MPFEAKSIAATTGCLLFKFTMLDSWLMLTATADVRKGSAQRPNVSKAVMVFFLSIVSKLSVLSIGQWVGRR